MIYIQTIDIQNLYHSAKYGNSFFEMKKFKENTF
jgi:hypothetical protein